MLTLDQTLALSANACKIYFLLNAQAKEHCVRIPISTLARQTSLSPRTCKTALAELRAAGLIYHFRRYHRPNTYLIPELHDATTNSQLPASRLGQPVAPLSRSKGQPIAPINCIFAPKTQKGQPVAPLLTPSAAPSVAPSLPQSPSTPTRPTSETPKQPAVDPDLAFLDTIDANLDLFRAVLQSLPPAEHANLLTQAQAILAATEAHP